MKFDRRRAVRGVHDEPARRAIRRLVYCERCRPRDSVREMLIAGSKRYDEVASIGSEWADAMKRHVMRGDVREKYGLEDLWSDAPLVKPRRARAASVVE